MRQNCAEAAAKLAIDSLERCMRLFGIFWHHEKVFRVRGFELCRIFRGGDPIVIGSSSIRLLRDDKLFRR
jgi:hypothetical protein